MESRQLRLGRWLAVFVGATAAVLGAVALANYHLNPLTYSRSAQVAAAQALQSGRNLMVADSNIDWRGIRREHIARLGYTPDVLIFGGSRWQEAMGDTFADRKMYTAFVQNDHLEDMMALTEILHSSGRMPATLVLSVRFATFEVLDQRVAWWWKTFAPEYRAMGRRLGLETRPWYEWMAHEKWASLLSVELLAAKARQYAQHRLTWQPTERLHHPQFDVAGVDGALRFSTARLNKENERYAAATASAKGSKDAKGRLTIDRRLLAQLPPLLDFLRASGVQVVFAQTPFHPAYYAQIKGTAYQQDLDRIEDELTKVAQGRGLQVIGGFDANAVGCAPSQFRDFNHGDSACLARILRQIRFQPAAAGKTPVVAN